MSVHYGIVSLSDCDPVEPFSYVTLTMLSRMLDDFVVEGEMDPHAPLEIWTHPDRNQVGAFVGDTSTLESEGWTKRL